MIGQTSGVRALQALKQLKRFIAAKAERGWFAEGLSAQNSSELKKLADQLDLAATKRFNSQLRHEHADAHALERDQLYARRSRRWLYTKALQTKLDGTYEAWAVYVRENLHNARLKTMPQTDADQLANRSFQDLL